MFEIRITPSALTELPYLTSALAGLAALLLLRYSVSALCKVQLAGRGIERLFYQVIAALFCILGLVGQLCFYSETQDTLAIWSLMGALAIAAICWKALKLASTRLAPTKLHWVLTGLSLSLVFGFVFATQALSQPICEVLFSGQAPGELLESQVHCGVTDSGTPVKLFYRMIDDQEFQSHVLKSKTSIEILAEDSIVYCEPRSISNCHGWVFAGGEHILRGEDVKVILRENGYVSVEEPQAGDVVIYRDSAHSIVHSGIVRTKLDNGFVLIESKWGFASTYLHLASKQPYSQDYSYYRSPRYGHVIRVEQQDSNLASSTSSSEIDTQSIN